MIIHPNKLVKKHINQIFIEQLIQDGIESAGKTESNVVRH